MDEKQGKQATAELGGYGFEAFFFHSDVSQQEAVQRTMDEAISRMGGLDILVNNAGIFPATPLEQMAEADIEKILAVNLKGLLFCTQEASRRMIAQQHGNIINIASIDSLRPTHEGLSVYDASKGAVLTVSKSLARELGKHGIRVNVIAPGGILTEGLHLAPGQGRDSLRAFMSRTVLGRMGSADDIGRVALFLASDLADYMTGSVLVVDGGYLLS
jgi:2-deoxy-D-gluconate 3-dehydrogenase